MTPSPREPLSATVRTRLPRAPLGVERLTAHPAVGEQEGGLDWVERWRIGNAFLDERIEGMHGWAKVIE